MFLRDLGDVRDLLGAIKGTFIGVGLTAYSRIIPALLRSPYQIVTLKETLDLPLLRREAEIFCLQEEEGDSAGRGGLNSASLLAHPTVKKYIQGKREPRYLFLYQSYPQVEEMAQKEGWRLLANPSALRMRVADRAFFYQMSKGLGLDTVPGDVYPLSHFLARDYGYWAHKLGPGLVVQFPDIRRGGGRGTFFVRSTRDLQGLQDRVRDGTWRGIPLRSASVHRFVKGTPASVALCLTRQGILCSGLQRQLIDLPYCGEFPESGIFCGHSWGESPWPSEVRAEALRQARLMGGYLARTGYRGILGIDFLISESEGRVYPLECNPRLTGAFPMLSLLHLRQQIIPMEAFHILELLGVPYEMDPAAMSLKYGESVRGSHIILFRPPRAPLRGRGWPTSGLYEWDPGGRRISYVQGAWDYGEIRHEGQFIIADGPPLREEGERVSEDPLQRLCRVLFPGPVVNKDGTLCGRTLSVVDWVYQGRFG